MRRTILFLLAMTCGCWADFPSDLLPDSGEATDLLEQEAAIDGGNDQQPDTQPIDIAQPDGTDAVVDAPLDTAPDTPIPDMSPDVPLDGPSPDQTPDQAADQAADLSADLSPDGPTMPDAAPDTIVDTTTLSCTELLSATVPGFVLCQETETLCTVHFNTGAGTMNCNSICGTTTCVGAADNAPSQTCTSSAANCEGKPCNCGAKMVDGLCNCSK